MKNFVDEKTVMQFYLDEIDADQIMFLKDSMLMLNLKN